MITNKLKKSKFMKKVRKNKWKNYSKRMMFSKEELKKIDENPDKISFIIDSHIKNNSFVQKNIKDKAKEMIFSSYLDVDEIKDLDSLINDMLLWYFKYGFSLNEYLSYRFINKSYEERMKFASDRDSVVVGYDFNDIDEMIIFVDKINTYNKFKNYFGREAISINDSNDYDKFIDFINKNNKFVKKEVYESCGKSIELIDSSKYKDKRVLFNKMISNGKLIIEELVNQGEETSVFNKSSVNTIRCITFYSDDKILIPHCFMKIGRDGSFIDNGGAGGILVGIDSETGVLNTDGVDEYGRRYELHPDSKIKFKDYQLPKWNEMIDICKSMVKQTKNVRFIGWDLAFNEDKEWIVIEGNALTEFIGPQSTSLNGVRDEIESFYRSYNIDGGI